MYCLILGSQMCELKIQYITLISQQNLALTFYNRLA